MADNDIREKIARLLLDEAFRITKLLYTHYEKFDQYAMVSVLGCLCKLTNVVLDLKTNAVFDAKDYADEFVYKGLNTVLPAIDKLYNSDEAEENPLVLLPVYEYPLSVQFAIPLKRIAYTCDRLLDRINHVCTYKPDQYNYNILYMHFADFTNHLNQLIIRSHDTKASADVYRSAPSNKSSSKFSSKVLLVIAIIVIYLLLHSKGVL